MSTRREFLASTVAASAAMVAGRPAVAAEARRPWSFALFGDTHFDRPEHHDMAWIVKEQPADVAQVAFYCTHAKAMLPELFATVKTKIAASRTDGASPIECAVHVGDFTEGVCGSTTLAERHVGDAIDFVERLEWGVPLLLTKGNHDVTGPGADEVYDRKLLPYLGRQAQAKLDRAHYAVERNGALFAMFDAYDKTSLDWLKETLGRNRRRGPTFVVVHPPIVPFQTRAHWSLYLNSGQPERREELMNLLGEHRAIVFCGHVHRYGVTARVTDRGPFVQLALSSILYRKESEPRQLREGLDAYGPDLVELEPKYGLDTKQGRREIFAAEKPFITHYEYADNGGHAIVHIAGDRVTADVSFGTTAETWRTVDLTALLG